MSTLAQTIENTLAAWGIRQATGTTTGNAIDTTLNLTPPPNIELSPGTNPVTALSQAVGSAIESDINGKIATQKAKFDTWINSTGLTAQQKAAVIITADAYYGTIITEVDGEVAKLETQVGV